MLIKKAESVIFACSLNVEVSNHELFDPNTILDRKLGNRCKHKVSTDSMIYAKRKPSTGLPDNLQLQKKPPETSHHSARGVKRVHIKSFGVVHGTEGILPRSVVRTSNSWLANSSNMLLICWHNARNETSIMLEIKNDTRKAKWRIQRGILITWICGHLSITKSMIKRSSGFLLNTDDSWTLWSAVGQRCAINCPGFNGLQSYPHKMYLSPSYSEGAFRIQGAAQFL